jgi:hypothetical protein
MLAHFLARLTAVAITLLLGIHAMLVLSGYSSACPKGDRPTQARADEDTSTVATKLLFDEKELYGRYYFGDGLGVNCSLVLETDHRFTFKWRGCLGEYDRNSGTWRLEGDILALRPEKPNKREGFQGTNLRFIPVKWGARYFLVDENEMPGFCAATSQDNMRRFDRIHGHDYVKWIGGELAPTEGKPIVPERYKEFLEKGPVDAAVVRIDDEGAVILNKGTSDRIKPGMLLAAEGDCCRIELKVVSAKEHESLAQAFYFWNSDRRVSAGDRFTTGTHWDRPWGTGFERFTELPKADANP